MAPEKFLFDFSFDQPDSPHSLSRMQLPPPDPIFTLSELEAGRAAAAAVARNAALVEAHGLIEQRISEALATLGEGLSTLLASREAHELRVQQDAAAIVGTILQKLAPAYSRKHALGEIEGLVVECLREAHDETRVVLRISEELFPEIRDRIGSIAALAGYSGKLMIHADATLAAADCRIEWGDGGVERDTARLQEEIAASIARAIDEPKLPGGDPSPASGEFHRGDRP